MIPRKLGMTEHAPDEIMFWPPGNPEDSLQVLDDQTRNQKQETRNEKPAARNS
jgi:hypothetical protein